MSIETKNDEPTSAEVVNWATAFGIALALGILATSVGLIRSETASDLPALAATGASSRGSPGHNRRYGGRTGATRGGARDRGRLCGRGRLVAVEPGGGRPVLVGQHPGTNLLPILGVHAAGRHRAGLAGVWT